MSIFINIIYILFHFFLLLPFIKIQLISAWKLCVCAADLSPTGCFSRFRLNSQIVRGFYIQLYRILWLGENHSLMELIFLILI